MTVDKPVALWYSRFMSADYEIYDDEAKAAKEAVSLEWYDQGSPMGIQFPDGRTIKVEDWDAYKEAYADFLARQNAKQNEPVRERETRRIVDPFEGLLVHIDSDEPVWLGKPTNL